MLILIKLFTVWMSVLLLHHPEGWSSIDAHTSQAKQKPNILVYRSILLNMLNAVIKNEPIKRTQLKTPKPLQTSLPEQIREFMLQAVPVKQRGNPILHSRTRPHQTSPMPNKSPQLPKLVGLLKAMFLLVRLGIEGRC